MNNFFQGNGYGETIKFIIEIFTIEVREIADFKAKIKQF
jgi:hypothetical protein